MMRCFGLIFVIAVAGSLSAAEQPNVILIITDDQGNGDLGCHGNPVIRTPNLDAFARQSVELTRYQVCPVCSPTRSSLLTGRYNYRTGVVDTYIGRSMMHTDETTIAEILRNAGYRTGIFGKWHLGDNYPLRPQDQGFDEVLVHGGGGIAQPADPPGGNSYFDPVLLHNGKLEKQKGYCSDVYTSAAIEFVGQKSEKPFFVYLAFNCPHDPLQVADELVAPYRKKDLSPKVFPKEGFPLTQSQPAENIAKVYAMVENIDANLGRLFQKLEERKLAENTIVIFMTDNGPAGARYNAGLRGRKGQVYDGGIRVPFLVRWPGRLPAGAKIEIPAAHIDVLPTITAACGVAPDSKLKIDGVNLLPVLAGKSRQLPERTLFTQWHRGDVPEPYRAFAARGPRWKLVQAAGAGPQPLRNQWKFELFDMQNDPYEQRDVAAEHPDVVADLKQKYEAWFNDVKATRNFAPPRIHVGTPHENPTLLTRQDWRGPRAGWGVDDLGYWEVHVAKAGKYTIRLKFAPRTDAGQAVIKFANIEQTVKIDARASEVVIADVDLPAGDGRLEPMIRIGERTYGVQYAELSRK